MAQDGDNIDFKPFLDMAIGILFILLILIASQMFFQRAASEQDTPPQDARQQRLAWEKEALLLVQRVATRLDAAGLQSGADLAARSVSLPLSRLIDTTDQGHANQRLQANATAAAAIAEAVDDELSCLITPVGACPSYQFLKLGSFKLTYLVTQSPAFSPALPIGAYARLVSSSLSHAIAQHRPNLFGLANAASRPAWEGDSIQVQPEPVGASGEVVVAGLRGRLNIGFTFDGP